MLLAQVIAIFATGDRPRFNGGLTASSQASGACSGGSLTSEAQVRLTCDIQNSRPGYSLKYYKDGVLLTTVSTDQETHDYTVAGFKQGTGANQFSSSYVFRVDLVDNATGQVLDSKTAATWVQTYSTCPVPAVSNVTASNIGGGGCNGGNLTPDTLRVQWSITNADNTVYATYVKRNGAVVNSNINNTLTQADHQAQGSESASQDFANRNYTFTVEVRRRSDGVVVASADSTQYTFFTGTGCGGPA